MLSRAGKTPLTAVPALIYFATARAPLHYSLLCRRGIFPPCVYLKPYRKWHTLEFTLLSPTSHAKVSWDLEFMGTRSSFSNSWIFFACLHILPLRSLFLANHFRTLPLPPPLPLAAAIFFSFSHRRSCCHHLVPLRRLLKSLSEHPSYTARGLNDLSAAHLSPVLLS